METTHHPESERAVVAAILLDGSAIPKVAELLDEKDFFARDCATIFSAIKRVAESGTQVDIVTVANRLMSDGKTDEAGSLAELIDECPNTANVMHYADIVKSWSIRRQIATWTADLVSSAEKGAPVADLIDRLVVGTNKFAQFSDDSCKRVDDLVGEAIDMKHDIVIPTGFAALDDIIEGFRSGQLVIIGGRPAMGKTALALSIARRTCASTATMIFSLEMSRKEVAQRFLAEESRINLFNIRSRKGMSLEDVERMVSALGEFDGLPLFVDDAPGLNPNRIKAKVLWAQAKFGVKIKLVFADYLQLMGSKSKYQSREEKISSITRACKLLARELDITIVLLSQLNREVERRPEKDRRPMMSDFRESGAIEQDADVIIGLFRPWVYSKKPEEEHTAEAIVLKQRNGPIGKAILTFKPRTAAFRDQETTDFF